MISTLSIYNIYNPPGDGAAADGDGAAVLEQGEARGHQEEDQPSPVVTTTLPSPVFNISIT